MNKWLSWDDEENRRKNPWGGDSQQNPPDLDEALKKMQSKLKRFFGGGGKSSGDGNGGGSATINGIVVSVLLLAIAAIWAVSGVFVVNPAEQAVITRFGKYVETLEPGIHWIPTFINRKYVKDVQKVSNWSHAAQMLTRDENIVAVEVAIHYRILNLKDYFFNVVDPDTSLEQATASALRQIIGHTTLDDILTIGREKVRQQVRQQLEHILERYETGIVLMDVVVLPARAPEEVKAAFDDAIKAQEDEQRYINESRAYAKEKVPMAEGQAKRLLEEARAYKEERIFQAEGDVARFKALLPEYKREPALMKERLYLDSMENVLTRSNKILLDVKNGQNLLYLPVDKMLGHQNLSVANSNVAQTQMQVNDQRQAEDRINSAEIQKQHMIEKIERMRERYNSNFRDKSDDERRGRF